MVFRRRTRHGYVQLDTVCYCLENGFDFGGVGLGLEISLISFGSSTSFDVDQHEFQVVPEMRKQSLKPCSLGTRAFSAVVYLIVSTRSRVLLSNSSLT